MSKKVNRVSDEEKARVVTLYLRGGVTLLELSRQVGASVSSVGKWVKCYTTNGTFGRYEDVKNTELKLKSSTTDTRDAEIARLKAALEKAELHVRALNTMIDVAEENFKIKIRKKAGAKR